MATMTQNEFMEQYGNVVVKFASYYKFTFKFTGLLENGDSISVSIGGDASDIYRMPVDVDEMTIASLPDVPFAGRVLDAAGSEVDSFYEYA